ncbi:uncharacterized protein [Triticum aestivum]|uniref:uncharacterized protein n=1 Tax=Triticum aestivum TaxID=4565 RepID=UPI001D0075E7|nr:uncharacterized protein LOC123056589 [Triticum aestivum]
MAKTPPSTTNSTERALPHASLPRGRHGRSWRTKGRSTWPPLRLDVASGLCGRSWPVKDRTNARTYAPAPPPPSSSAQLLADTAIGLPATKRHVKKLRHHEISFPTQRIGRIRSKAVAIILLPRLRPPSFVVDCVAFAAFQASPTPPLGSRDESLREHLDFLEQQGIAGVSHHSLLFSKTEVLPTLNENDHAPARCGCG